MFSKFGEEETEENKKKNIPGSEVISRTCIYRYTCVRVLMFLGVGIIAHLSKLRYVCLYDKRLFAKPTPLRTSEQTA